VRHRGDNDQPNRGRRSGGAFVASTAFVACGTGTRGTTPPRDSAPPSSSPTLSIRHLPAEAHKTAVPATASPVVVNPPEPRLMDCETPRLKVVSLPDGGIPFNNAMTSVDAGFIDRTQGVLDVLWPLQTRFSCCLGARDEGIAPSALLVVVLAPDGAVKTADVDAARSSIGANSSAATCLTQVVREAVFPPSPTSKETIVELPLVTEPR